MTTSECDFIVQELKGIREELHMLNRNIQFQAIMTSNMPNQSKAELLDIIREANSQE